MKNTQYTRRKFLTATGAAIASATVGGVSAPFVSARAAEKFAASRTMRVVEQTTIPLAHRSWIE